MDIFSYVFVKIVMFVWKDKNIWKEAGDGPFLSKIFVPIYIPKRIKRATGLASPIAKQSLTNLPIAGAKPGLKKV